MITVPFLVLATLTLLLGVVLKGEKARDVWCLILTPLVCAAGFTFFTVATRSVAVATLTLFSGLAYYRATAVRYKSSRLIKSNPSLVQQHEIQKLERLWRYQLSGCAFLMLMALIGLAVIEAANVRVP